MRKFYQRLSKSVKFTILALLVLFTTQMSAQCNLVCPNADITVTIPFGDCSAAVNHGVTTTGFNCNDVLNNFEGEFDPSNWTFTSTGDGSVDVSSAPAFVELSGNNNGVSGSTMLCIELDFHDFVTSTGVELETTNGMLSFDWAYQSNNSFAGWDPLYVRINGVPTAITAGAEGTATGNIIQNGSNLFAVNDGDVFCFDQRSFDGTSGGATSVFSNLTLTYDYLPTLVEGFASGEDFPLGTTTVTYAAFSGNNSVNQCTFDVIVEENMPPISSITCNNVIQISLDENCEAVIDADQILEGGNYGCYDKFEVILTDENGISYGNMLTAINIGQNITATVVGPNGNECWGTIEVADKSLPPVLCEDSWTRCHMGTDPGDIATGSFTFSNPTPQILTDNGVSMINIDLGLNGFSLSDLQVSLDISHDAVNELSAVLKAPTGQIISLFDLTGSACGMSDLDVTFTDNASLTHVDFASTCNPANPTISGNFQSEDPLSTYEGIDAGGTWMLIITDASGGNTGTLNEITMDFSKDAALISFPWPTEATWTQTSTFGFTVFGLDPCGPTYVNYVDNEVEQDCDTPYEKIIYRTWNGEDAAGNRALECIQAIYVYRNDLLETLVWPSDYDDLDQPSLSCVLYGTSVPEIDITGEPTGDFCAHIQIAPPTDTKIDICENTYKIIRHWTILDWCTGILHEHDQIIKVLDNSLDIICPNGPIAIDADDYSCTGSYVMPAPTVNNECSGWTYEIAGVLLPDLNGNPELGEPRDEFVNGNTVTGLPYGNSWVIYTATDNCGNTDECSVMMVVSDNSPPVAVCDEQTVVGIGADGWGVVNAITFDDGSWDNCEIDYMDVRKMTNICPQTDTNWGPDVKFCCDEVGQTIMVAFRVTDIHGNQNTCMVEVTVQDKLPPYTSFCPDDVTIDCDVDYSVLSVFGSPTFVDNCLNTSVDSTENHMIDNCGRGTIVRTWTFTDHNNGYKANCEQTITIENSFPFVSGDISWPLDYDATGCNTNLDPENLPAPFNYPVIDDDKCSLAAATYTDQLFSFSDGACLKILRTWTVIDWCTYNSITNEGLYQDVQVIKLNNTVAPTFTSTCQDTVVCHYNEGCLGEATLSVTATDDCTSADELMYWYEIDIDNTGDFNFEVTGSGNTVTRTYSQGTHYIRWYVEDRCGNVESCDYLFTIQDCKKPTPYCLSSVTSVVMNNNGMLEIWASDFDFGSFDNCTPQEDLLLSFSSNTAETNAVFTCNDIQDGQSQYIPLELWVTDEAGNQDYCSIAIILQDNEGDACQDQAGNVSSIAGRVITESNEKLEDLEVQINSNIPGFPNTTTTDTDGEYSFNNLLKNNTYYISTEKNDDPLNGVSTLDLVLIQKHILLLQDLGSPYKIIAADANDDGTVSAVDLVHIRKLLLGITLEFPNGQESWRFVDENYSFSNPANPFPYDEVIDFVNLNQNMSNQNFVAIKIADVNGTAVANNLSANTVESRNGEYLDFVIENHKVTSGQEFTIPVYASNFNELVGYQFSIDFDPAFAEFNQAIPGALEITEANFGHAYLQDGVITTSWNTTKASNIDDDEVLFELSFTAKESFETKNFIDFGANKISSEAYNEDLEILDVRLLYRDLDGIISGTFELLQNVPNPFSNTTTIEYKMPDADNVTLTVYDVAGKVLHVSQHKAEAGLNQIELGKSELNATGVMYYQIATSKNTATKKMIGL